MAAKYGVFPRTLGWGSLVFALYIALLMLFSHPLGFFGSIIVMCLWVGFAKVIHFAYEPSEIMTWDNEDAKREARAERDAQRAEVSDPGEWAGQIAQAVYADEKKRKVEPSSSRILGSTQGQQASSRLLGAKYPAYQEKSNPEAEQRKEDSEWADMFRAL